MTTSAAAHGSGGLAVLEGREVRRGLGQLGPHQRQHEQARDTADDEHRAPAEGLDQQQREQGGQHGADVVAGHHPGDGGAVAPGRGVLAHVGQRRGQAGAETQAAEEAQHGELGDVLRGGDGQRQHGEQRDADQQRPAAAEPVGQRADRDGTDADADQADRGGEGQRGVGEAERAGLGEHRDDGAEDDEVEPVEGDRDPAEPDGPEPGLPCRAASFLGGGVTGRVS